MRAILLNPGPVSLSEAVRSAAMKTDLCHREAEFYDLQARLRTALLGIYGNDPVDWSALLLSGSGTTAMEAMVSSLVPRDGCLLVLENGIYGERLSRIAEIHGIGYEALHHEWMDAWDLKKVSLKLAGGEFTHVAAVHHETTTGRLNPARELAELCEKQGVRLLLDAVSSFGAEDLPFGSPALAACAATANKCLHGITGLCMVICRRSDLQAACEPPRSLVLHLPLWGEHQDRRSTPFTPPVNAMLALDQALVELAQQGGWTGRHARYHRLAETVGGKLAEHGIGKMLPEGESSSVLRAYRLPGNMSYEQLHDGLKQRGFVIYAGQGALANEMFRVSTMGDISDDDRDRLLAALEAILERR